MARVNVDILGIRELKWTGMGEFNSDDHIYYCGQESLRRNGAAIMVNKRVRIPLAVVLRRPARGAGTLIPSAQRLVWAAKQALGNAALGALFA